MIRCLALSILLAAPVAAQTQAEMNVNAATDYRRADAALNSEYRLALSRAKGDGPSHAALLIAAQRAWIAFRDAECRSRSSISQGGSIHAMLEVGCRAKLTRQRTGQLKERADDRP